MHDPIKIVQASEAYLYPSQGNRTRAHWLRVTGNDLPIRSIPDDG